MTSEETYQDPAFSHFLIGISKALSQVNLYSLDHPMVKNTVSDTLNQLTICLANTPEISIAYVDEQILVNGKVSPGGPGAAKEVIGTFFKRNQLHSLVFRNGVNTAEFTSFLKLFLVKQDQEPDPAKLKSQLASENVTHIEIDTVMFSKVQDMAKPDSDSLSSMGGTTLAPPSKPLDDQTDLLQRMTSQTLEENLWEIIRKVTDDPDEQVKIFELIIGQIKNDLKNQVERATRQLRREKDTVTNEKERTESVIEQMAEGVVVVDTEGKIIMMNPTAEKIYGSTFSALKGKKLEDQINNELMVTLAKDITTPTDQEMNKEARIVSTEETYNTLRNSTAKIEDPEGKIVGMLSILNDIAKQKELQRMQTDFISNVTHELRTPMTAIKASISTIIDDDESSLNPQQKHILGIASRNIDRLSHLISDLLDFGKGTAGKITLNLKPIDPHEVLLESIQNLEQWATNRGISLTHSLIQDLPKILADRDRLTQIMVNLLSNAVKFTPHGGTVTVSAEKTHLFLKVLVSDTGPGISPADQKKIFEKFFQLKASEKSDTPGTGLGLHITKTLVNLHGGEINLQSEVGKGTTFYFTLPVVPESQIQQPTPISQEEKAESGKGWLSRLFGG